MARAKAVRKQSQRPRAARRPAGKRAPYHHGDLRRGLLDAALHILGGAGSAGSAALTLRAAARQAGVSQAAPYRHFADKEALLAAVAEEGYLSLTAAMRAAAAPHSNLVARFAAVGQTYVRYAVEHPAQFRVMFGRELAPRERPPGVSAAAQETFALLTTAIEQAQQAGLIRPGDPGDQAIASWSMVHGLAGLLLDGRIDPGTQDLDAFIFRVVQYLFLGLRNDAPSR
jgi:AcrR family transcriptional regulator